MTRAFRPRPLWIVRGGDSRRDTTIASWLLCIRFVLACFVVGSVMANEFPQDNTSRNPTTSIPASSTTPRTWVIVSLLLSRLGVEARLVGVWFEWKLDTVSGVGIHFQRRCRLVVDDEQYSISPYRALSHSSASTGNGSPISKYTCIEIRITVLIRSSFPASQNGR